MFRIVGKYGDVPNQGIGLRTDNVNCSNVTSKIWNFLGHTVEQADLIKKSEAYNNTVTGIMGWGTNGHGLLQVKVVAMDDGFLVTKFLWTDLLFVFEKLF